MKIKEILNVTKGKMLFGNEELEVENFSKDTRTIQKGDIYIGIKGDMIMETKQILKDIGKRCQGDIYLGIVGPVRSGKSTFIKRFMEMAVIPYIEDPDVKIRTIDELPQSGKGKMIMTVEPKFIPNQAVKIDLQDDFKINVRLVDCVGYVIEGASGYQDDSGIRLVKTPWYNESIPFDQAAKIGTKKVIQDHSTIGIVVTSDGSFLDIDEQSYHSATKEIIQELQDIGKPFIVIVNSKDPSSSKCQNVVESYQKEYDVPIIAIDTTNMLETQIVHLLQEALNEFGIHEVKIEVPRYIAMLNQKHWLKQTLDEALKNSLVEIKKIKDVKHLTEGIESYDFVKRAYLKSVDTSHSSATIRVEERNGLYDELLTNIVGYEVDRSSILALLQELMTIKDEYDGISNALSMVRQTGYGYAIPRLEEIELSKNAQKQLFCEIKDVIGFSIPNTDISRSFVVFEKKKELNKKYPRQGGKPKKSPL